MRLPNWLFTVLVLVSCQASAAEPLYLTASEWPPYIDSKQQDKGFAIDLIRTAFKRGGYDTTLIIQTWPRALEGARLGVYDVIGGAWYSEERARDLAFSEPFLENRISFIEKKGNNFKYESLADLRGRIIGITKDFAYDEEFVNSRDLIKVSNNYVVQSLIKVLSGDVHLALADERVARAEIERYMPGRAGEFRFLPKPLAIRGLRIAVSKQRADHEEIVAAFERAIAAMKLDGSYARIPASAP